MQFPSVLGTTGLTVAVLASLLWWRVEGQDAPSPTSAPKPSLAREASTELKGMPPRISPAEYAAQASAGAITIGAEFMGHSVPTPEGTYTTPDFVVVEVGLFSKSPAVLKLSREDLSLRINGKKTAVPSLPYELVFKSLKDPEWEPPSKPEKSKTSFGTGGGNSDSTPIPVHMPFELRRAMEQRVQRTAMLEGDRSLPQAGLVFFDYKGKVENIRSLELIYSGSGGNATLALQP